MNPAMGCIFGILTGSLSEQSDQVCSYLVNMLKVLYGLGVMLSPALATLDLLALLSVAHSLLGRSAPGGSVSLGGGNASLFFEYHRRWSEYLTRTLSYNILFQ